MSSKESRRKWILSNPELRNEYRRKNYSATRANATNGHQRWSAAEIAAILADNRPTDREISAQIGRSVQSIQIKRTRSQEN